MGDGIIGDGVGGVEEWREILRDLGRLNSDLSDTKTEVAVIMTKVGNIESILSDLSLEVKSATRPRVGQWVTFVSLVVAMMVGIWYTHRVAILDVGERYENHVSDGHPLYPLSEMRHNRELIGILDRRLESLEVRLDGISGELGELRLEVHK